MRWWIAGAAGVAAAAVAACGVGGAGAGAGRAAAVKASATAPTNGAVANWPTRVLRVDDNVAEENLLRSLGRTDETGSDMPAPTLVAFRMNVGTAAVVDAPIVRVETFADDVGTDLGSGRLASRFPGREPQLAFASAGQVVVRLISAKTPAAGATRLIAKGVVVLRVGEQAESLPAQEVVLRVGRGIKRAGGSLLLTGMTDLRSPGQQGIDLQFMATGNLRLFKEVEVTATDGAELEVHPYWALATPGAGLSLRLDRAVDAINLKVAVYGRITTKEIPFSLSTGVGVADVKEEP